MTHLPKLTKRDALGHWRFYWGEILNGEYRTHSQRDARATPHASAWTRPRPSARRTSKEQCEFELTSIYTKRRRMGWSDFHPRQQRKPTSETTWYGPMLAQKYPHVTPRAGHYAQPKLDGIRCVATNDSLVSRKNIMLTSVPQLVADVYKYLLLRPQIKSLDGEIYLHGKSLHEISGLARRKKDNRESRELEFHVFDCRVEKDDTMAYADRLKLLTPPVGLKYLKIVDTQWCDDEADRDFLHARWIRQGYEGSMYRDPEGEYVQKRTKFLLKRKDFIENEFTVIGVREGNGAWRGCAKAIDYIDERGETFDSGIRGTQAYLRTAWQDRHKIVGTRATVRYFSLTPDRQVPYLPVTVNLGRWDLDDNTMAARYERLKKLLGKREADRVTIPF